MATETKETKKRANPDYSKSIVNQTNPDEVKMELCVFYQLQLDAEELRVNLEQMPEFKSWVEADGKVAEQKVKVQGAVDTYGSYQDVENGVYGLKYNRHSKEYHVQPFLEKFSKFAPIVVEQTINERALQGQIKGGLITEDELREAGVITETATPAYYIR